VKTTIVIITIPINDVWDLSCLLVDEGKGLKLKATKYTRGLQINATFPDWTWFEGMTK